MAPVDEDRLVQVLTNLVENGLSAGGPAVTVRLELGSTGGRAVVDVGDNGWGIPEPDRDRVFERLVRLDAARSSPTGSGLGLPIARGIAEAHGGSLTLMADPPGGRRGAHFRLELPRG